MSGYKNIMSHWSHLHSYKFDAWKQYCRYFSDCHGGPVTEMGKKMTFASALFGLNKRLLGRTVAQIAPHMRDLVEPCRYVLGELSGRPLLALCSKYDDGLKKGP
uniref:Uncharacterized protein n=1 Tax=Arundo donax TaxID=35708 RepID=A0A0A9HBW8_ARUDO